MFSSFTPEARRDFRAPLTRASMSSVFHLAWQIATRSLEPFFWWCGQLVVLEDDIGSGGLGLAIMGLGFARAFKRHHILLCERCGLCEGFNDLRLKRSGCCAVGSIPRKEKLQCSPILAFTKLWIWHDSANKVSRVRMHCFRFYLLQTIYLSFRSVLLIPNKMLAHLHDPLRASQIARSALQS